MTARSEEAEALPTGGAQEGGHEGPVTEGQPAEECIAAILAENRALRAENATLQSLKDALQESEERYRRLFEDDLTGDFITTADGRIIACNPAFVRIFGFASVEEALKTNILELYEGPGDRELLLASLQKEGKIENQGRTRKRRDGTRIHVVENMVGRFDADGGLIEIQAYTYDDSERKRVEDALRESEERFRAVLENSLDVAYRRNLQVDRYDYMSPVVERILGFTAEEMAAMGIEEIVDRIHPDDRASVGAELGNAIVSGQGLLVYRFRAKHDEYRWLEDHFTVIRDPDGRPLYRGGIVRDVTGRKEAEEELVRVHQDLESAHREANHYLDILTHDIGNTENVSNLYAELLLGSLHGEAACYAASLKKSISKSIEILGIVSKIRRIHAGPPISGRSTSMRSSGRRPPTSRIFPSCTREFPGRSWPTISSARSSRI
mgnify:CR=1 FL=1